MGQEEREVIKLMTERIRKTKVAKEEGTEEGEEKIGEQKKGRKGNHNEKGEGKNTPGRYERERGRGG